MNQIPVLALSRAEQHAVLAALRQAGVALKPMCVSRLEMQDGPSGDAVAWISVTSAGWCRSYQSRPGWERELVVDLQVNAAGAAPGARA